MKRAEDGSVSPKRGFSLVEVLLALAMAAVGFGVVLHSVGRQMAMVSGSLDRHQMLMYASEALESNLARGVTNNEVEPQEIPIGAFGSSEDEAQTEAAKYFYKVEAAPVTADPRVEQVTVTVSGDRGILRLSAYRLKVRRE
ncbi:MAG: prepilin-type N-terminal cleavage/methylation domain-containing protein [Candidatus Eremiobacteraeota bacterium]|nr:prepilin-type N-terminal cleavage/methylation domain-containing protein [Candidatus Eremiobacteraeota bacterium]